MTVPGARAAGLPPDSWRASEVEPVNVRAADGGETTADTALHRNHPVKARVNGQVSRSKNSMGVSARVVYRGAARSPFDTQAKRSLAKMGRAQYRSRRNSLFAKSATSTMRTCRPSLLRRDILDAYKKNGGDWATYEKKFWC